MARTSIFRTDMSSAHSAGEVMSECSESGSGSTFMTKILIPLLNIVIICFKHMFKTVLTQGMHILINLFN